jgi:hypothetical protein
MKFTSILLLLLAVFFMPVFFGCNKNKAIHTEAVTGTVTLDGQPVEDASITFVPKSGGTPAYAHSGSGGVYALQTLQGAAEKGTTVGEYFVTVTKSNAVPSGKTEKNAYGNAIPVMESNSVLPEIYASSKTTPLTFTVNAGTNKYDIPLQSKP